MPSQLSTKQTHNIIVTLTVLSIFGLLLSIKNYLEIKNLYCDLYKSVMAEREYIYPILRKIDNPMNYGPGSEDPRTKNLKNPITTNEKYVKHCK